MKGVEINVWSDVACPWCYVGKRRLEAALAELGDSVERRVHWRAFQLDASAPARYPQSPSYRERLARKYGLAEAEASRMLERMQSVGRSEGIAFDFEKIQGGNTFDAHRLLCFAHAAGAEHGVDLQGALKERLLRAYFSEGVAIGDPQELLLLASDVGLDVDRAGAVLASGEYASEVSDQQQAARQLGVHGVPFFVIGKYGISGAQPAATLLEVLERALEEAPEGEGARRAGDEGSRCAPESCDP